MSSTTIPLVSAAVAVARCARSSRRGRKRGTRGDTTSTEVALTEDLGELVEYEWLVECVASEPLGNIPEPYDPDDDSADVGSPGDDSAVAGFRCEWSPNGSWRAVVTRGPLKGKDYVTFLRDLTQDKWDRGARLLGMKTPFDDSDRPEQRQVWRAFLEDVVRQKMEEAAAAPVDGGGGVGS